VTDLAADLYRFVSVPNLLRQLLETLPEPTPISYALARAAISDRTGRQVTTEAISVALAHSRNAWGTRRSTPDAQPPIFLLPALRPDGSAAAGWLSRSDWRLRDRLVPRDREQRAIARATAALQGRLPGIQILDDVALDDLAISLRARVPDLFAQYFGTRALERRDRRSP
jgi:hypothetical protein